MDENSILMIPFFFNMITQAVMERKTVYKWEEIKRSWKSYYRLKTVCSRISEVLLEMGD